MPLKKSELYASLWASCDELRGSMDASQYKDYVLVLLFMKYVSDKAASRPDYDLVVPSGGSFADMVALKGKPGIGEGINKVIATLAAANDSLIGAIDVADFNDPEKLGKAQEMVDRLTELVGIFENPALDFRGNSAEGDDLLGDAYEYLMRNFATESGKSKGQFYTPAEVSRVMAQVVGVTKATSASQSIYDPTCGSGSLLLKAHDAARDATGFDLAIYGQEMDNATAGLARMNMVLHDAPTAEIWQDNTLAAPHWRDDRARGLKTFDFIVANPPFSAKSWMSGFDPVHDLFNRFPYGLPPKKNGDYAFLLHMLASLKSMGRAAVILPHGVLFRGNQEGPIRRELIRRGYIEAVIGLPPNLFYGTSIPACVIVLDKAGAAQRSTVFMVDASRGFIKDGNKNRLRERDIHRILDAMNRRTDAPGYSRTVPINVIEEHDYNLALPRYIESPERDDVHDLTGHLIGAIPTPDVDALDPYWRVLPGLRDLLVAPAERDGYSHLQVEQAKVPEVIEDHPRVRDLRDAARERYANWSDAAAATLRSFRPGDKPKVVGAELSEAVLAAFDGADLVDAYGAYQRFMDYWVAVLQDDLYLLTAAGWESAARPHVVIDQKGQKVKTTPDFTSGKTRYASDLLPAGVLVEARFARLRDEVTRQESVVTTAEEALVELVDQHSMEGGALEDLVDDGGKVVTSSLNRRLRELSGADGDDDRMVLVAYVGAAKALTDAKSMLRSCRQALNDAIADAYLGLDEDEIKRLTIERKWLTDLGAAMEEEAQQAGLLMSSRLRTLGARYGESLPSLVRGADAAAATMEAHYRALGLTW
jgi:type I restriction enzyme M protein